MTITPGVSSSNPRWSARGRVLVSATGALLLAVGALAFAAVAWSGIGPAGRFLLVSVATVLTAALAALARRRTRLTAEALLAATAGLVVADWRLLGQVLAAPYSTIGWAATGLALVAVSAGLASRPLRSPALHCCAAVGASSAAVLVVAAVTPGGPWQPVVAATLAVLGAAGTGWARRVRPAWVSRRAHRAATGVLAAGVALLIGQALAVVGFQTAAAALSPTWQPPWLGLTCGGLAAAAPLVARGWRDPRRSYDVTLGLVVGAAVSIELLLLAVTLSSPPGPGGTATLVGPLLSALVAALLVAAPAGRPVARWRDAAAGVVAAIAALQFLAIVAVAAADLTAVATLPRAAGWLVVVAAGPAVGAVVTGRRGWRPASIGLGGVAAATVFAAVFAVVADFVVRHPVAQGPGLLVLAFTAGLGAGFGHRICGSGDSAPVRCALGCAAVVLLAAAAAREAVLLGAGPGATGLAVVGSAAAVVAGVGWWRRDAAPLVLLAACLVASAGVLQTMSEPAPGAWPAAGLAVLSGALAVGAVAPRARGAGWGALATAVLASWAWLGAARIDCVEAATWPLAAVMLAAGVLTLRDQQRRGPVSTVAVASAATSVVAPSSAAASTTAASTTAAMPPRRPSWPAVGPGLVLGFAPTAALVLAGDGLPWRLPLLVVLGTLALLAGHRWGLQAATVVGMAALGVAVARTLTGIVSQTPVWVVLVGCGIALLWTGFTWERRWEAASRVAGGLRRQR